MRTFSIPKSAPVLMSYNAPNAVTPNWRPPRYLQTPCSGVSTPSCGLVLTSPCTELVIVPSALKVDRSLNPSPVVPNQLPTSAVLHSKKSSAPIGDMTAGSAALAIRDTGAIMTLATTIRQVETIPLIRMILFPLYPGGLGRPTGVTATLPG